MKRIFFFCMVLFVTTCAYSQQKLKVGLSVGGGLSDMPVPLSPGAETKASFSYYVGLSGASNMTRHVLFRLQLRLISKGTNVERQEWNGQEDVLSSTETYRINYLEVPLAVSIDFGKSNGFILTAGLYGGIGLWGMHQISAVDSPKVKYEIRFSNSFNEPGLTLKPFDYGGIFGIGYRIDNVYVDLLWNGSIGSIHPEEDIVHILFNLGISVIL